MNRFFIPEASSLLDQLTHSHGLFESSLRSSVEHAVRCGEILEQLKNSIPPGQWTSWATDNLPFSVRAAYRYMKVATVVKSSCDRLANDDTFSIADALAVAKGDESCERDRVDEEIVIDLKNGKTQASIMKDRKVGEKRVAKLYKTRILPGLLSCDWRKAVTKAIPASRPFVAAELMPAIVAQRSACEETRNKYESTGKWIQEETGVRRGSLDRACLIVKRGIREVVDAVKSGRITMNRAWKISKMERGQQMGELMNSDGCVFDSFKSLANDITNAQFAFNQQWPDAVEILDTQECEEDELRDIAKNFRSVAGWLQSLSDRIDQKRSC